VNIDIGSREVSLKQKVSPWENIILVCIFRHCSQTGPWDVYSMYYCCIRGLAIYCISGVFCGMLALSFTLLQLMGGEKSTFKGEISP